MKSFFVNIIPIPLSIEICIKYANTKNGKCLSIEYKNISKHMLWECNKGHQWNTAFAGMRSLNQWCPYCSGKYNNNLELCQKLANERGGKCLSTEYKNNKTYMLWECSKGHQWNSRLDWMKKDNSWCPYCSGNGPLSLNDCNQIANERGGKCLSTEYKNNKTYMLWECSKGHQWENNLDNIKNNNKNWCPYCKSLRTEKLVRNIIEQLAQCKFIKCRPQWLDGLEMDGYNDEEKIAFEYNGIQHYKYTPYFHKSEDDFIKQQERDNRKYDILKSKLIDLIIIPYTYNYQNKEALSKFLQNQLIQIYINRKVLIESNDHIIYKYHDSYIFFKCKNKQKRYKKIYHRIYK